MYLTVGDNSVEKHQRKVLRNIKECKGAITGQGKVMFQAVPEYITF